MSEWQLTFKVNGKEQKYYFLCQNCKFNKEKCTEYLVMLYGEITDLKFERL